jgi:hypothetical protein
MLNKYHPSLSVQCISLNEMQCPLKLDILIGAMQQDKEHSCRQMAVSTQGKINVRERMRTAEEERARNELESSPKRIWMTLNAGIDTEFTESNEMIIRESKKAICNIISKTKSQ